MSFFISTFYSFCLIICFILFHTALYFLLLQLFYFHSHCFYFFPSFLSPFFTWSTFSMALLNNCLSEPLIITVILHQVSHPFVLKNWFKHIFRFMFIPFWCDYIIDLNHVVRIIRPFSKQMFPTFCSHLYNFQMTELFLLHHFVSFLPIYFSSTFI